MLEQADSLLLHQLRDHVAKDCSNGIESLIGVADIPQPKVVKKNLLYNENSHGLAQFGSRLHYSQAQRYDLRGK